MIKNYFFLKHIIYGHDNKFKHAEILSVYTQTKNEIIFETTHGYLLINFDKKIPYLVFKEEFHRRGQSMTLIPEITSEIIESVHFLNDKRIIEIKTTNTRMMINLFYRDVGMTIYSLENNIINTFKTETPLYERENISDSHLYSLLHHEISFRECAEKSFINELNQSDDFYFYRTDKLIHLTNVEFSHLKLDAEHHLKHGIYEGYNRFVFSILSQKNTGDLSTELTELLKKKRHMFEVTVKKLEDAAKNKVKKEQNENYGHLIMANLHAIKPRQKILEVADWNTGEALSIKLNPESSPHQNAENYYRKAKGLDKNEHQLTVRKENIIEKLKLISELELKMSDATYLKHLEKVKKICVSEKWMNAETNKEKRMMQQKSFNYYEFKIDGHDVLVGKDAKSNDFLSLKYSKANDYWFHVQGSPGSHVILKWHGYKEDPEKELLKKVAALTAYYSKMKNAGNIPVIYTQSKFVKKPRGAKPGAVTVQQEKSIFVKPSPIEEL